MRDDLSELLDTAFPACPRCGTRMDDAGTIEHPSLHCPSCGYDAVLTE